MHDGMLPDESIGTLVAPMGADGRSDGSPLATMRVSGLLSPRCLLGRSDGIRS